MGYKVLPKLLLTQAPKARSLSRSISVHTMLMHLYGVPAPRPRMARPQPKLMVTRAVFEKDCEPVGAMRLEQPTLLMRTTSKMKMFMRMTLKRNLRKVNRSGFDV